MADCFIGNIAAVDIWEDQDICLACCGLRHGGQAGQGRTACQREHQAAAMRLGGVLAGGQNSGGGHRAKSPGAGRRGRYVGATHRRRAAGCAPTGFVPGACHVRDKFLPPLRGRPRRSAPGGAVACAIHPTRTES